MLLLARVLDALDGSRHPPRDGEEATQNSVNRGNRADDANRVGDPVGHTPASPVIDQLHNAELRQRSDKQTSSYGQVVHAFLDFEHFIVSFPPTSLFRLVR